MRLALQSALRGFLESASFIVAVVFFGVPEALVLLLLGGVVLDAPVFGALDFGALVLCVPVLAVVVLRVVSVF